MLVQEITMTNVDFARAVKIANDAGQRGMYINISWHPPTSATQIYGIFGVDEYRKTGSGQRET